jgi:hypothetical protein
LRLIKTPLLEYWGELASTIPLGDLQQRFTIHLFEPLFLFQRRQGAQALAGLRVLRQYDQKYEQVLSDAESLVARYPRATLFF